MLLPFASQAQTTLTFGFEDNAIPAEWINDATYPWAVTSTSDGNGHTGTYCIKSSNSGVSSSTSAISATFTFAGDGSISFLGGIYGEGTSTAWDKCIFTIDGVQQFAYGALAAWSTYSFEVEAGTHTFTWSYTKDGSVNPTGDAFYVDDVVVNLGVAASCARPTAITINSVMDNAVSFAWTPGGNETAWKVYLYDEDDELIAGYPVDVTNNSYTLTGLTASTSYTVGVKANCGDELSTERTATFTTACAAITSFPYSQNFDNLTTSTTAATGVQVNCWDFTMTGTSTYQTATYQPQVYYSTTYSNSGNYCLRLYGVSYLCLPPMGEPLSNLQLNFNAYTTSTGYKLAVGVMEGSTFVPLDTVDIATSTHAPYTLYFSGYNGNSRIIAFRNYNTTSTTYYSYYYIDDVVVDYLPSCFPVSNVAASAVTSNSITLTWDDAFNTGATYTVADAQGTIATGISGNTYTVTNLNSNTEYTFYLIANCSATDNGDTVTFSARTACGVIGLPYTCGFEVNELQGNSSNAERLPWCWTRYASGTGSYTYYPYSNTSYVHEGSRALYFYCGTSTSYPDTQVVILPEVDVQTYPMNGNRVTFWARMSSASYSNTVYVGTVTDPTDPSTFVPVGTVQVSGNVHTKYAVPMTAAAGSVLGPYVAIVSLRNTTAQGYMTLDDLTLEEMPACLEVSDVAASDITSSSMSLTWSANADNASATYTVYNMADTSVVASNLSGTTYTVTNLTPNTQYTFGVQANCPAGDAAIMTVSGHTTCGAEALPWTEDFSSSLSNDICWRGASGTTAADVFNGATLSLTSPSSWTYASSVNSGIAAGHYYKNIYGTGCKSWLITPAIDLTTVTSAQLSFDVVFTGYNAASPASGTREDDKFMVIVSADGGNTWLEGNATKWQASDGDYTFASIDGTSYQNVVINLNAYLGDTIKIAFYAESTVTGNGDNNLHIDNIAVTEMPSCLPVTNLTIDNITDIDATFSWQGNADSYKIYDMADTSLLATTTTNTFSFSGLLPNTVYGLGVAAVCGTDDESEIVAILFRSACGAVALPYTESFELTNTYNCWDFVSNNTANDVNSSDGMGLVALGNSIVWRFSSYSSASDYNQYGYSPVLDASTLTGADVIRARVRYATYGSSDKLNFGYIEGNDTVWDPTDYTTNGQSDFREYEALIPLTATKVAIHYYGSFSYYAWIDTVELTGFTIPPCAAPTNVSFVGADTNMIAIAWEGDSTALYAIFDMSDTSLLGTITGNSAYINGLTPSTQYTFGVATVCDYSISDTVTVTANTACGTVAIPFTEDFEATSNTLGCWTIEGNNSWSLGVGDYSTSTGAFQGAQNARITHGTTGDATKLVSPALSGAENGLQLTFAHVQRSWSGDIDELRVYFRTDTASAWQQLVAYTDAVPTWTVETINIPSAVYQVAFEYTDNYGYGVGLDSVVFNMPPSCMPAAALTVDSANATSISLSWTGNAASYTVYNMSDTTVLGTTTTTSFTVTGLTAMTAYTFGVAANCGNEVSEIVTINAATACGGTTCNISIVGADSYGDGWNGNAINVMQAGVTIGTFTLTSGASYTESFSVCSGTPVAFAWVEGNYADEASFQILDGGNTTVHSVADGSTLVDGAVFYTLTDACPACLPAVVTVDNVAETSVTISWTGNAASYDVYNGTTFVTNTTATTYTFTGLTAATSYTFGVQAICSATDSASIASVNVMTACADITALPYTEGFENGLGCWSTVNGSSDGMPWFTTNSSSSLVAHSGNAMAASVSYYNSAMHANAWLISPKFVLPTINAGDSLNFGWWHKVSSYYPTELYDVMISTTTNDTAAFTTTLLAVNPDSTDDWVNNVVNLNAYAGQSVYIAFHHHDSYDQNYLLIDDITLSVGAAPVPVPDTLTVTFAVENATMGTTVPAPGTYQYITGDTVRFQAVPNNGYHFTGWIMSANGDNDTLGAEYISAYVPANVVMSYGSMTLTALFEAGNPDSTTITYAVNDATMGTTVPAPGTHTIYVGNTIQATAIPNPGYMLNAWVFDILIAGNVVSSDTLYSDDPDFANPMVFGSVPQSYVTTYNASFGVTAIFDVDTNASTDDITVVLAVNDATMGTTNPAPGTYTFAVGDSASVAAIANNGYHFVNWTISMGGVVLDSSLTEATYSIDALPAMLAGMTLNVMANFAADSTPQPVYWTVSVSSANDTMGTVTPAGDTLVLSGDSITVHAIANEGFHFAYWMTGNNRVTDQADFTFAVVANTALVAVFESDTVEPTQYYHVTGLSNDNAMGYVELVGSEIPSALVEDGETVTLIAHANDGYRFVRWSTGETTESINITVDGEDVTVTAYFELVTGIEDADMNDVTIYSTDSKIVVRGAEGNTVYVFDVNGRLVSNMANATETVEFRMANTGVYLVKVGAAPAKRVLVVR